MTMPPIYYQIGDDFVRYGPDSLKKYPQMQIELDLPEFGCLKPDTMGREARLPYEDPSFGTRVLSLHLDPATDQASRRVETISAHVNWMAEELPGLVASNVFHPMCGPGLYAQQLLARGVKSYTGLDINVEAVNHATTSYSWPEEYTFMVGDALSVRLPVRPSYRYALLTYEAINSFPQKDARALLSNISKIQEKGDYLILEVRMKDQEGQRADLERAWEWHESASIFVEGPHLVLTEAGFIQGRDVYGSRTIVLSGSSLRSIGVFHSFVWLHSVESITQLLHVAGYGLIKAEQPFCHLPTDLQDSACNTFVIASKG